MNGRFAGAKWLGCVVLSLLAALIVSLQGQEARGQDIAAMRESALKGDVAAQFQMGQAYEDGMGVETDNRQAANWYEKAAQQGHTNAMFRLGLLYGRGRGVAKDLPAAVKWLQKADEKGHPDAKLYLQIYGAQTSTPAPARSAPPEETFPEFPSNRLAIAVLGFPDQAPSDQTAHWFHAFPSLLRMTLASCKGVRVLRRGDIDFAYKRLKLDPARPLDAAAARRAGELLEARRVVWGQYQREGKQWVVKAWVMPVAKDKPATEIRLESPDWQEITSRLVLRVLEEVRITPTEEDRRQITRRHTTSLEALDLFGKAVAAHNLNRSMAEVEAGLRKALALDASFWPAQLYLAMPLASEGRFKEAREAVRRAVELNPGNAYSHVFRAVVLQMDAETREEARGALLDALKLDPSEPETWQRLAQIYDMKQEGDKRLACLLMAARLSPASADIHAQLADAYAEKPDRQKALAEIAMAQSLNEDETGCYQFLASAYLSVHDLPGALQAMERLVDRGRVLGFNPPMVAEFAKRAEQVRQRLTPHEAAAAHPHAYSTAEYEAELRRRLTASEFARVTNPLTGTAAMKPWVEEATRGATNQLDRARRLVDVLFRKLEYGRQKTRTAAEAFADMERPGSRFVCADLALLYVALGRAAGLDTFLTHVDRDAEDVPVRHDCAAVFLDGQAWLADPTAGWFGAPHKKFQVLDDLQSTCHYLEHTAGDAATVRIAAKLEPEAVVPQFLLAAKLAEELKWQEATTTLEAALRRDAQSWWAYRTQGHLQLARGNVAAAEPFFRKSLELLPTNAELHYTLGAILMERKQLAEARDYLRLALGLGLDETDEARARQWIAEINERLGTN
jgi:tetratricopeptide (TPR) repeat protein